MKVEKGNENEVWFFQDRNIPSLTINLDKHSKSLFVMGWKRVRVCCADLIIDEKGQENMFMIVCGGMR